jgi:hypothetical protein
LSLYNSAIALIWLLDNKYVSKGSKNYTLVALWATMAFWLVSTPACMQSSKIKLIQCNI